MTVLIIAVVVWAVLLAIVYEIARSSRGFGGVHRFLSHSTLVFFFVSFALFLQALLTLALAYVFRLFMSTPRAVVAAFLIAMVVSFGFALSVSVSEIHRLARLRQEFPIESLSNRLAYESRVPPVDASPMTSTFTPLSRDVEMQLVEVENRRHHGNRPAWRDHDRARRLAELHQQTADRFAVVAGFGAARMLAMPVVSNPGKLSNAGPIRMPWPRAANSSHRQDASPEVVETAAPVVQLPDFSLRDMHNGGVNDFLNEERMGYIQNAAHVVGFEPHQFTKLPAPAVCDELERKWTVVRLELISLLKHETPAAYVSEHLPRMDELRDAPRDRWNRSKHRR